MEHYTTNIIEKLGEVVSSTTQIVPELVMALGLILLLLVDLTIKRNKAFWLNTIAFLALGLTLVLLTNQWLGLEGSLPIFSQMAVIDHLGLFVKFLIVLTALLSLTISHQNVQNNIRLDKNGEYHVLLLGLSLGAMVLAMSTHLLLIYIGVELMSISAYLIINFKFSKESGEASLKYLLFGALASAFTLYGISLLYGFTGTLDITSFEFIKGLLSAEALPVLVAAFLTLIGLLFKISVIPFHYWTPDAYQSGPTSAVAVISIAPKLAALVVLVRLLKRFDDISLIFVEVNIDWQLLLSVVAVGTMLLGNLAALSQNNLKRMLAYSSIAHAGFLMASIMAYTQSGIHSMLFYGAVYLVMNMGIFIWVGILEKRCRIEHISELAGLGKQWPFAAIVLTFLMVSLTGLPPTAGFTAKFLVFGAVWEAYQQTQKEILFWLFLAGLFNTVIALFYYLKIPYYLFFKENTTKAPINQNATLDIYLGTFLTLLLLVGFILPNWLLDVIEHVNFAF